MSPAASVTGGECDFRQLGSTGLVTSDHQPQFSSYEMGQL